MKRTNSCPPFPDIFVSGKRAVRAIDKAVRLEAEPPWVEIPPAWGPSKPNREARVRVVDFSIMESAGETAKTCRLVLRTARSSSEITPTYNQSVQIMKMMSRPRFSSDSEILTALVLAYSLSRNPWSQVFTLYLSTVSTRSKSPSLPFPSDVGKWKSSNLINFSGGWYSTKAVLGPPPGMARPWPVCFTAASSSADRMKGIISFCTALRSFWIVSFLLGTMFCRAWLLHLLPRRLYSAGCAVSEYRWERVKRFR